jgi:hypothetical protein
MFAAINIAKKGDDVFHRSKCLSGEAMVVESCLFPRVIRQVDERKFEAHVSIEQNPQDRHYFGLVYVRYFAKYYFSF